MARIVSIEGEIVRPLSVWEFTRSEPSAWAVPSAIDAAAEWLPAAAPGTVAAALQAAGQWDAEAPAPLEDHDYWYRTQIAATADAILKFGGLATLAEVYLDGRLILTSDNMFLSHEIGVTLQGTHNLAICFRALAPVFQQKRKRARWRPRMASPPGLRFVRTTLLGHMPGWCPPIQAVGPWRAIDLVIPGPLILHRADLRTRLDGDLGVLEVKLEVESDSNVSGLVSCAGRHATLRPDTDGGLIARLDLPDVKPWWPHTHGAPTLYPVTVTLGTTILDLGRVGFRRIEIDTDTDGKGFGIRINDVPIFCRGACWTNADLIGLSAALETYEPILKLMRDADMNMVRIGGTMLYEGDEFYRLCDELGLMVWQDFCFSNFDYPADDADFVASVSAEARQFLSRTQASPSITVLCGASEVAQQAAMFGLPAALWSNPLFEDVLPAIAAELRPDAAYVAQTPFGGELPFVPQQGRTHYYGVSAYCRPLDDARRAHVRFATECLGFANIPDIAPIRLMPDTAAVEQPLYGERYERDMGAVWFFEDVRNHYLETLYGISAEDLRREDPAHYLDLSRATSAEIMQSVFSEWRRKDSPTQGGLVWFLQDLASGAGWGVIDRLGHPKAAYWGLRRAFRPVNVILTDEGLNGLWIHLVNETAEDYVIHLSLACLKDGKTAVMSADREMVLPARRTTALSATELWGGFFDTSYAYRFGAAAHDVTVAYLYDADRKLIADAFHFPNGRGAARHDLGLNARLEQKPAGEWSLYVSSSRFAQSVHIDCRDFRPDDNWFHLAPDIEREFCLTPLTPVQKQPDVVITAVNGEKIAYSSLQ